MIARLLASPDPAIRRLAGDARADPTKSPRVRTLLEFPEGDPYRKWWGTHWRLVALADLGLPPNAPGIEVGIEQELEWLTSPEARRVDYADGLVLRHASIEGNAVYAASRLGFELDPRVRLFVDSLIEWQWPDGGWNCDENASGRRSSFHESWGTGLGLAAYHSATGDTEALEAAKRRDGRFSGPSWGSAYGQRESHPFADRRSPRDAVDWGRGPENEMLNLRAEQILVAGGRV